MATVPVKDLLSRDYVGVSESDTVLGATELMRAAGETAAVVLRGQDPVGMLTAGQTLDSLLDGADLETTPVSEVMDPISAAIDPGTTVEEATRRLVGNGQTHLLVTDQTGAVLGVLDARDLAAAKRGTGQDTAGEMATTGGGTAEQAAVEEGYSNQSICEGCGSFTQDLVNVDGKLLCPDCRSI